jgi:hypothetical protein
MSEFVGHTIRSWWKRMTKSKKKKSKKKKSKAPSFIQNQQMFYKVMKAKGRHV